jgi:hypothetical protein
MHFSQQDSAKMTSSKCCDSRLKSAALILSSVRDDRLLLIKIKDRFLERETRPGGDETGKRRRRDVSFIGPTRSSPLVPSSGQRGSDMAADPTSFCPPRPVFLGWRLLLVPCSSMGIQYLFPDIPLSAVQVEPVHCDI